MQHCTPHLGRRGVAATEFAIIVSVLSLMMVGTYDYGMAAWHKLQVSNATSAGAAYASYHGFDAAAITIAINTASNYPAITASPAPTQFCGCPNASTGITQANCGGTCSGGTMGKYIRVSARAVYPFLLTFPGRATSIVMQTTGVARVE